MAAQSEEVIQEFKRRFRFHKFNGNLENYFNALLYLEGVKAGFTTNNFGVRFNKAFGAFAEKLGLPVLRLDPDRPEKLVYYSKEDEEIARLLREWPRTLREMHHGNDSKETIGKKSTFQFDRLFGRLMGYPTERIDSWLAAHYTPEEIQRFSREWGRLPRHRETRSTEELKRRHRRTVRKHHRILGFGFRPVIGSKLKPLQLKRI